MHIVLQKGNIKNHSTLRKWYRDSSWAASWVKCNYWSRSYNCAHIQRTELWSESECEEATARAYRLCIYIYLYAFICLRATSDTRLEFLSARQVSIVSVPLCYIYTTCCMSRCTQRHAHINKRIIYMLYRSFVSRTHKQSYNAVHCHMWCFVLVAAAASKVDTATAKASEETRRHYARA